MRISYSALESFENCPKKYEFKYIDKIKAPKSKEQILGTVVHLALKYFHSTLPTPKLSQLLDFFKERWPKESIWDSKEEEKVFFEEGLELLRNYYQRNYGKKFSVIDVETNIEAEISESEHPEAEKHIITGRIDRIDKLDENFFEIIDYKTGKKMPSQAKVNESLQLGVYSIGFVQRWPHLKEAKLKLSLWYLKHQESLSVIKTDDFVKKTKEKIVDLIKKIKKSKFPPLPSSLCDFCAYKKICPLWRHLYEEKALPEEREILKLVKEFLEIKKRERLYKERLNELKREINRYLEAIGLERLFVEECFVTRSRQIRENYDFGKVKEILQPLGYWEKILEVDRRKFNQILEELPKEIKEKIEREAKLEDKEYKVFKVSFSSFPEEDFREE